MLFYNGQFSGMVTRIFDYPVTTSFDYTDVWATCKDGMPDEWPIISDMFNDERAYFVVVCPD